MWGVPLESDTGVRNVTPNVLFSSLFSSDSTCAPVVLWVGRTCEEFDEKDVCWLRITFFCIDHSGIGKTDTGIPTSPPSFLQPLTRLVVLVDERGAVILLQVLLANQTEAVGLFRRIAQLRGVDTISGVIYQERKLQSLHACRTLAPSHEKGAT